MKDKHYGVGFTLGTFDLFHVGHLYHLRACKSLCDHLVVGVQTDTLCYSYKEKYPVICEEHRLEMIKGCKYVDNGAIVNTFDLFELHNRFRFDVIFVGDDWIGSPIWDEHKKNMETIGVDVVFTSSGRITSSTEIRMRCRDSLSEQTES